MEVKKFTLDFIKEKEQIPCNNWKKIRQYFRQGYVISSKRNGVVTLKKVSRIMVTFEYNDNVIRKNVKKELSQIYEGKCGWEVYQCALESISNNKLSLEIDSNNNLLFIKK